MVPSTLPALSLSNGGVSVTSAADPQLYSFSHAAMGTIYSLYLYANSASEASDEAAKAFAVVDDLDALLSNYKPQSELSRINDHAYPGPVTTDPETFRFLEESLRWSARSDGAFDITVGALMKAWGFFRSEGRVPSQAELSSVQAQTGWRKVRLDAATRTVRFTEQGIELDPGGIGKGFAVERVVEMLRADGVQSALLSAGGSTIYALGAPPGKAGWRVNIPDPCREATFFSSVVLRDTSLSTASFAEKHFVLGGHLYCGIMDPRLGAPVEGRLQATVVTPNATDGDALSNIMFVDGAVAHSVMMRRIGPAVKALVISGSPVVEGGQTNRKKMTWDSYGWPGPLPPNCPNGLEPKQLQPTEENK